METLTYSDLCAEFRMDGPRHDPYGHCMSAWFALAAEMFERGLCIPDAWQYRPPPMARDVRDPDDWWTSVMAQATDEALEKFGEAMRRLYEICKAKGLDY